jgi:hypothetical protein
MKIINNESVVPIDVDGTLILPFYPEQPLLGRKVYVFDHVSNNNITMVAHEPNIRLLLEEKHRGSFVVVWSKGGYQWATNVVKALKLEDKVDLVMTKPRFYIDDLPVEEWLKERIFLLAETKYKR